MRVPFQRRHALLAGRHVPHLERLETTQTRRAARPETRQRQRTHDEARSSQKYTGRRNARDRVPFQRRHAFAGRHVPHLERVVGRPRHDAPPVRKHGNAPDLRRSHVITKSTWTPRAVTRVPFQRRHAFAGRHVPHLERLVARRRHDAPPGPSGNTATQLTYDEHTSSQKYSGRRNARNPSALPASPRICRSRCPHLERAVLRPRHDAPPVRKHGNAHDLHRRHIITKVQRTPQRTSIRVPFAASFGASTGPRPQKMA